jgi:hypothetical protein
MSGPCQGGPVSISEHPDLKRYVTKVVNSTFEEVITGDDYVWMVRL